MISAPYFWMNIFILGIGTFAIRYSMISLSGRIKIPLRVQELFPYIPAAIIPALVAPMAFFHSGSVAWLAGKERVFVLALTTVVCAVSKSTLFTILFGLVGLYFIHRF